ncbi:MAG: AAA family ATPase, partial [Nitrospinota bacterium]|nr:AAA family ATPase [Nitrospinota bacterium]
GNFTLQTTGGGAIKWDNFPSTKPKISAYVVPSRRSIEARFSANPEERSSYVRQSPNFTSRRQTGSRFSSRLSRIDNEQDKFLECLNRILPNPPSWYMEKSDPGRSEFYLKVTSATSPHDSDGLGSGVASAIHVADALYDSPNEDIVGIDEPELSLHPAAQRRLASVLVELSAYRQIIIATHSPFFAPLECLSSGMMVARVYQRRGGSIVGQLEKVTAEKVSNLLKDSNNPHVLGLDAREVLFLEDDVILVEGQEDVEVLSIRV